MRKLLLIMAGVASLQACTPPKPPTHDPKTGEYSYTVRCGGTWQDRAAAANLFVPDYQNGTEYEPTSCSGSHRVVVKLVDVGYMKKIVASSQDDQRFINNEGAGWEFAPIEVFLDFAKSFPQDAAKFEIFSDGAVSKPKRSDELPYAATIRQNGEGRLELGGVAAGSMNAQFMWTGNTRAMLMRRDAGLVQPSH